MWYDENQFKRCLDGANANITIIARMTKNAISAFFCLRYARSNSVLVKFAILAMMINPKQSMRVVLKHARRGIRNRPVQQAFLHKNVPYFSQWESPELVEKIINQEMGGDEDPKWRKSGAKTKDEYAAWSWNGCGMACTKMLVAHLWDREVPLVELGKKCAEYGGYTLPVEDSNGLIYGPYVKFVKEELGLKAKPTIPLLIREIIENLSEGKYVIASVSPKIRHTSDKPKVRGGHLVLMLGYDLEERLFYFHNPSGFTKDTQEYASIGFADFKKFFGGRGIIIYK